MTLASLRSKVSRLLPTNTFARGVGVLVGGTVSSRLLLVLASPLLTRLYSPEDFGLLAVYAGLLSLITVIASLRYELAIPLPKDDIDAIYIVQLSFILVLVSTVLTAIFVYVAGGWLTATLDSPALLPFIWLLPLGVLFGGSYNVFRYWAIRAQHFGVVASTTLQQSIGMIAIQIIGFKFGVLSLLLGQAAGQGVGATTLGRNFIQGINITASSWKGIWQQTFRYKRFPLFSTWEGLFNTAGTELPPLLFAAMFSPAAAGLYSLANRFLSLPMSLIGSAIGQVFFSSAAEARREGRLGLLVSQLHSRLAHIGMPPAVLLVLVGPELFSLVFGYEWRAAGEFARWMTPWMYLVFVSSPLSTLFAVMEKQKHGMAFQAILLAARLVALVGGTITGDLYLTVLFFSFASAVCWFGFLLWIGFATNNSAKIMLAPTIKAAGFAVGCSLPTLMGIFFNSTFGVAWLCGMAISMVLIGIRFVYLLRRAY